MYLLIIRVFMWLYVSVKYELICLEVKRGIDFFGIIFIDICDLFDSIGN